MSALHVHGQVTPTSKVTRNPRRLASPLKRSSTSSPRSAPRRPARAASDLREDDVTTGVSLPVTDFTGLDVLSAIDHLKRLQSSAPTNMSTARRTTLLNRRRQMPPLVLGHQIASLFPNMRDLEKEINALVTDGRIVELPMQDGEPAYLRREDYHCPPELLTSPIADLEDATFRKYAEEGWLLRRNGVVVMSAPNTGTFFSALKLARKYIMAQLKSRIALEKDVRARYEQWKDGGLFQFENLMHDLVGSGRVEILMLTVGRALRLTKRGRDGK